MPLQQRLRGLRRHLRPAPAANKYPPPPGEARVPAIWGHSPGLVQQQRAGLSPAEDGRSGQVEQELLAEEGAADAKPKAKRRAKKPKKKPVELDPTLARLARSQTAGPSVPFAEEDMIPIGKHGRRRCRCV